MTISSASSPLQLHSGPGMVFVHILTVALARIFTMIIITLSLRLLSLLHDYCEMGERSS